MYLAFFSSAPIDPSEYSHVLQVSLNYPGNPSCNEHMYQPLLEHRQTTLVILCVMNCAYCPYMKHQEITLVILFVINVRTYKPYMECQETLLVTLRVMNAHTSFI